MIWVLIRIFCIVLWYSNMSRKFNLSIPWSIFFFRAWGIQKINESTVSLPSWCSQCGQMKCKNVGRCFLCWMHFGLDLICFTSCYKGVRSQMISLQTCALWGSNIAYPTGKAFRITKKDSKRSQLPVKCLSHSLTEGQSLSSMHVSSNLGERSCNWEWWAFVDACSGHVQ